MLNIYKLEALIKAHGWSNTYFSSLFGKSRSWISDMKHSVGLPDENTLQEIADKLGTTIDYLTDKTEQKNKPVTQRDRLGPEDKEIMDKLKLLNPGNRNSALALIESLLKNQDNQ